MSVAGDLAAAGIAVVDDFLSVADVHALHDCARVRAASGGFRPARVGAPGRTMADATVRGDAICWLEPPYASAEIHLLAALEALRLQVNRELQLGLFDLELHYARYPPGAAYQRHVDRPQGRGQRRLSVVIYLNEGWDAACGGQLRLYGAGAAGRDVLPLAGRLACFVSEGREHEVLSAARERLSVTGWFLSR